jgi:hypothetical protein
LREKGWRPVVEKRHVGKDGKINKWCRYQSPVTNRLYTFLDAQHIMEHGWNENAVYPDTCCKATIELNKLAGDNFTGNIIETWFYIGDNGEHIHQLWG